MACRYIKKEQCYMYFQDVRGIWKQCNEKYLIKVVEFLVYKWKSVTSFHDLQFY